MRRTRLALTLSLMTMIGLAGCGAIVDARADRREATAEAAYPPEGQILDVAGRKVHAVVRGSGPDLVLIHGASGNARDFTFAFMDRMATRYRVIAFDRPGLGWTDRVSDSYGGALSTAVETPAEQAAMLQAAAAQLGATRPIVLGHSFGGAVALAWALERPGSIGALVVVAGASNPWPGGLGALYGINSSRLGAATVVPLLTAFAPLGRTEEVIDSIFAPQQAPDGCAAHVGAGLSLRRESLRANARQVNSLLPHVTAMAQRYAGIGVPTEIVHGTLDEIVPLAIHSEPLARQIPGARLTRLEGIGHMPHHAAPEAVAEAIDRAASRAGLR